MPAAMDHVSYFDLGATLYTPCTHRNLPAVIQQGPAKARSMVYCLEDAVRDDELNSALDNLKHALHALKADHSIKRFIRVRDPQMLSQMLSEPNIGKVNGFVLPKFDLDNSTHYENIIKQHRAEYFSYMPTLETTQAFDPLAMRKLADQLQSWGTALTCLRIGGNDLSNLLGLKRSRGLTVYDTPLRTVIDQLIITFRPRGFELSAPVFDYIDDPETLAREVARDIAYGFYAKTAIHPKQIQMIEQAFHGFSLRHFDQAEDVLDSRSKAVFLLDGQMMEATCHRNWALRTTELAERYTTGLAKNCSYAD